VRPEIVVSVRYHSWTDEGRVRHPVFRGVRHDVPPEACRAGPPRAPTHEALADYYETVLPALMRYLGPRSPGVDAETIRKTSPPFRVRTDGWIVFDCDTSGALALRSVLEDVGLPAFVKTGEAWDYQVIAPVGDAPPNAGRALAELMTHLVGGGIVRVASSPILAPYSPIAGEGSRVSTPIPWREVIPSFEPRRLTTRSVPARLKLGGDPMAPLLEARIDFHDAIRRVEARAVGK
jgi:DNA primase